MTNATAFSGSSTMAELEQEIPGARRALFRLHHIGGCSSCGFRPEETLAEVCARNGDLDPDEVLEAVLAASAEEAKLQIAPTELMDRISSGTVRILDIRTREEFDAARIDVSTHFDQELLQEIMTTWPKDAQIVLVDHQGDRSLDAAAYFAGHGFTHVLALRGGIDAWSLEADPSVPRYTLE